MQQLRLHLRPHLVDIPPASFLFVLLPLRVPRPHAQEARHVHPVDLVHPPAAFYLILAAISRIIAVRE